MGPWAEKRIPQFLRVANSQLQSEVEVETYSVFFQLVRAPRQPVGEIHGDFMRVV
jgi:hypothetical protein